MELTITAKIGNEGAEESSVLWLGRQPKNSREPRRDLQLSQPLPIITAEQVAQLPAKDVAEILTDAFAAWVRRVKVQRLTLGSSISLVMPDGDELPRFMLAALQGDVRERKLLSAASVRDVLQSTAWKSCAPAYIAANGIKPDAWQRIVVDEVLRGCLRQDAIIYASRHAAWLKAATHLGAIADACSRHPEGAAVAPVLSAAVERITSLPVVPDDAGI